MSAATHDLYRNQGRIPVFATVNCAIDRSRERMSLRERQIAERIGRVPTALPNTPETMGRVPGGSRRP
jgi:hypothetical protein